MTWFPPVHAYEVYLLLSIQVLKTRMPNLRLFQFSNSRWEIICKLADILIKKLFHSYFRHCWNVLMKDWLLAFVLLALGRGNLMPQMIVWNTATNVTWIEHQSKLFDDGFSGFKLPTLSVHKELKFLSLNGTSSTNKAKQVGIQFLGVN